MAHERKAIRSLFTITSSVMMRKSGAGGGKLEKILVEVSKIVESS